MIEYRTFRNADPPLLATVWTASLAGPRTIAIPPSATTLLEYFVLSKPYFDPAGLTLALADGKPVGFVHVGFAGDASSTRIDPSLAVLCTLGVVPSRRRQGIGRELLRRAEAYARGRGATRLVAGPMPPENPYLFGLYGGCDTPGVLDSLVEARPFFESAGYTPARRCGIYQLRLADLQMPADPRFSDARHRFEIVGKPQSAASWYRESVLGPIEVFEYELREASSGRAAARLSLWDMDLFAHAWHETSVGMLDVSVEPAWRRRGLVRTCSRKYCVTCAIRRSPGSRRRIDHDDAPTLALLRGLGFAQIESGTTYRRDLG